jgi:hypothetical protein
MEVVFRMDGEQLWRAWEAFGIIIIDGLGEKTLFKGDRFGQYLE